MNVADRINQLGVTTSSHWITTANRFLPPVVCAVLVLAMAFKFAQITWSVFPGEDYGQPRPEVASNTGQATPTLSAGFDRLRESHLFGVAPATPEVVAPAPSAIVDAPDTTLNLKLSGVVARENNPDSEAMITTGNQPDKLYLVGDTVEGASGATLHHVFNDRVILNRNGRLETLRLPEEDTEGASVRRAAAIRPTRPTATNSPAPLRQVISENATDIARVMRFAPHVEGGQIVGFRVSPGVEGELFTRLGLEAGDVVTDINGIQLDDPSRGLEAFQALGETTMANVTILRNGTPEVIVIDTNQLSALSEGRQ